MGGSSRGTARRLAAAVAVLASLSAALFSRLTTLLHDGYNTAAYDLGTFDQGIWLAGHSNDLFVTVRGLHLLGDHVRLFAFVLAPLYWVWDDVRALLVAQSLVIAAGSWLVWRISSRLLPGMPWVSFALAVSWLLNPANQNLNLDHAHPDAFAQTLVLAAVNALLAGRTLAFWMAAALAMSCKEDVPLVFVGLGLAWALRGPDRRRGLVIAGVAAAVFATFLLVVLPAFNDVGFFRYGKKGFLATFWYHGGDPAWLTGRLVQGEVALYFAQLALPVLGLFVCRPLWLLPALPALFTNLVSDGHYMRGVEQHYQTSILPFLYVASAAAVSAAVGPRVAAGAGDEPMAPRNAAGPALRRWLPWAIVPASVAANLLWSHFPLTKVVSLGDRAAAVARSSTVRQLDALVAMIPPGASVAADYSTVPHLSHRRRIYMLPNPFVPALWGIDNQHPHDPDTVEYVLVRDVPGPEEVMKLARSLEAEGRLELVAGEDEVRLYRRSARVARPTCGDADGNAVVEPADVAALTAAVVRRERCPAGACDVDGDGAVRQSDAQRLVRYLRDGSPALACPAPPSAH